MKVELVKSVIKKEDVFPALYTLYKGGSLVVLLTSKTEGTVLIGNNFWESGDHSNAWVFSKFKRLPAGTVVKLIQE